MSKISRNAKTRGMTPDILENILNLKSFSAANVNDIQMGAVLLSSLEK